MKIFTALKLLSSRFFSRTQKERDYSGFVLAEKISNFLCPSLIFSEYGRIWLENGDFFNYYKRFDEKNFHSADRKFFLNSLLSIVENLEGDTAECGVFEGASSWLICDKFKQSHKVHYIFDSFEGLSNPSIVDGEYWQQGALNAPEEIVLKNLSMYQDKIKLCKGWIPDKFYEVSDKTFCFVHIDVDLYQPTLDSISYFYPRLVKGGIILCDDYGFSTCPGAKKAFDEYMEHNPENIVHVPTGQGFIIKQ